MESVVVELKLWENKQTQKRVYIYMKRKEFEKIEEQQRARKLHVQ